MSKASKPDYVIVPKVTVISNPAINFGTKQTPLPKWECECLSFEARFAFGKPRPVPWLKSYSCRATDEAMATQLLAKLAYRDGYALGGIQNVRKTEG